MKGIVIGLGEIGFSLYNALDNFDNQLVGYDISEGEIDLNDERFKNIDIMNICVPYSDKFIEIVKGYQKQLKPKYTVIHSTVPVGTTRKLKAIHSPCTGIHPDLEISMKTFWKYLGGKNAGEVADYFRRAGMRVYITDKPETTELMKIMSTTMYGVDIEYTKEVKRQCDKYGVPFEFWTLWTENYNEGYKNLGHPEFARPNLIPNFKKIGGHCVLPNAEILDSKFTKLLKELNESNVNKPLSKIDDLTKALVVVG